jgi:hypothetical protein
MAVMNKIGHYGSLPPKSNIYGDSNRPYNPLELITVVKFIYSSHPGACSNVQMHSKLVCLCKPVKVTDNRKDTSLP